MKTIVGYGLVILAIFLFYQNWILAGTFTFVVGGGMAERLSISLRTLGLVFMVSSGATIFHQGFGVFTTIVLIYGFYLANSKSHSGREWGFDIDWSDIGDGDGGGGGD